MPTNVAELQQQMEALKLQLAETEADLKKKADYISYINQKHQDLVSRSGKVRSTWLNSTHTRY